VKKGFQVHETPDQYASFIPWLRTRVVRYEIPWYTIERSPGVYTEVGSNADWHYQTCLNQGAVPLIILGYEVPSFHKLYPGMATSPPKDPNVFYGYARWMAQRYPHARAFEIWNEPNQAVFWGNNPPNPYHYAKMLTAAHDGIKSVSDTPVFSAGTASIDPLHQPEPYFVEDWKFVKRFQQAGGRCDVVAFHAYESLPRYLGDRVDRFRKITKKPLSCTEFGWTTHHFTEAQQAAYIKEGLSKLDSKGVYDGIVYTLRDPQTADPTLNGFGMLRHDFVAKPSAHSFRSLPPTL
jgi:endo-1,4-beta-mannosidase